VREDIATTVAAAVTSPSMNGSRRAPPPVACWRPSSVAASTGLRRTGPGAPSQPGGLVNCWLGDRGGGSALLTAAARRLIDHPVSTIRGVRPSQRRTSTPNDHAAGPRPDRRGGQASQLPSDYGCRWTLVKVFTSPPTCNDTIHRRAWLSMTGARPDDGGVMPLPLRNAPPRPSPATTPSRPAPKAGLTVSKVIAGAGAAATSAVAGSAFGADGTVVGAAVGSVVSTVAAVAYERSLDRTRQVVVSRVRLPNGRTAAVTQVIPADVTQVIPAQQRAAGARPTPAAPLRPRRRPRLPLLAGATALIFLIGLLGVTGVELLAGGPILSSQQGGTSVGRVLGDGNDSGSPATTIDSPTTTTTSSATAPHSSAAPTTARQANPAAPAPDGAAADNSAAPSATPPIRSAHSSDTTTPVTPSRSPSGTR